MASTSADEQSTHAWMSQKPIIVGARRYHGWAKIDENRIIIVGGKDKNWNELSSGFIYNVRTQQS
eukprot:CAMPEP_0196811204 /NCGR_PEP_ID=MMETSP1362-20130617/17011_1 /TAXON_ID=163516 /ORGANISM="Leptocylindrus danicus, Strain CCMP1856" /LENGTH=64 /DNA_ID=CAMNT_0042186469 /DNA_START=36 /DNA_END=227 /DNA_ORIENTATION=-